MPERVSVILPVNRWSARADGAVASVLEQKGIEIELLVVTNGDDAEIQHRAADLEEADPRVRTVHSLAESLPRALNLGLRECSSELVARMDADDRSLPGRLARQVEHMNANPTLAGCGCGAEFLDSSGHRAHVAIPPSSPAQTRWKLLVSNTFVHGSMMLRREMVLDAGGYNERLARGQDYELWVRLAERGLGGVPEILYSYLMPEHTPSDQLDSEQSDHSARVLLNAWAALPSQEPAELQDLMARMLRGDASARADLEAIMERDGPSRETMQAWTWSCRQFPIERTDSRARAARIRAAGRVIAESSIREVWLWGAGDLARTIIGSDLLGVPIAGVADDARAGEQIEGKTVCTPEDLPAGSVVLIASDLYEDAIWERSAPLRGAGVRVMRMPSR